MTAGKELDWWARHYGDTSDWDTYLRTGGSLDAAATNIRQSVNRLMAALHAITQPPQDPALMAGPIGAQPATPTLPDIAEPPGAEPDEPPDPDNAHPQGDQA